ncbi:chemotaxis protein CheW [Cryptosporangium sp. NPDC048952]|uniref:chemotaxis protein CheW n=1 Tax=Cryptosporangium sp. NPDC048952 TaxID=3363961 RepID=UPI00370F83A1
MTLLAERPAAADEFLSGSIPDNRSLVQIVTGNDTTVYGMFTIGPSLVALPLSELREVIPCPSQFSQLPARAPGLLGAVNLRHLVIPVLDLRQLIGIDDTTGTDVIVIVAREGKMFGLLADEIRGVVRIPNDALMEMAVGGPGVPLFQESFEQPDDGSIVAVLDSAAIFELPGVPVVKESGTRNQSALAAAATSPDSADAGFIKAGDTNRRVVMLLRCANIGLSIDVNHVHSVIPKLVIRPSPLVGESCLGVVTLGGKSVPVVDSLQVLGFGQLPKNDTERGIVLTMPRGLVVLSVSDVTNIESVPATDVLPLPTAGMAQNRFVQGALLIPGKGQNLVLNGEALRCDEHLDNLANMGMPLEGSAEALAEEEARNRRAQHEESTDDAPEGRRVVPVVKKMLTYNAGVDVASPLVQIKEILPYPTDYIPLDAVGATIQGVFTHRRATVPLICLSTLLGRYEEVDRATARVLLVDAEGGGYVGFIVPSLNAIEESIWEEVEDEQRGVGTDPLSRRLIKVGTPESGRMLPEIDLERLAAST